MGPNADFAVMGDYSWVRPDRKIGARKTRTVTLSVPFEELEFHNAEGRKVLEPGEFIISLGHSSDDIRHTETITL